MSNRLLRRRIVCWWCLLFSLTALVIGGCTTPQSVPPKATRVQKRPPPLVLRDSHPQHYVVQPGDTVWGVSEKFLHDPWRWHELWPRDEGPKLYPGDVIELRHAGSKAQLRLAQGQQRRTIKLKPKVHYSKLGKSEVIQNRAASNRPIPTLTPEAIRPFLDNSVVLSNAAWKAAPYIIGSADGRPLMITDNVVFAQGARFDRSTYAIYRPQGVYRDPSSHAFLGFNMLYIGLADVQHVGNPTTVRLKAVQRPVAPGDRLLPEQKRRPLFNFSTRAAPPDSRGYILSSLGSDPGIITRYDTVAVDLGRDDGMRRGSVLAVYHTAHGLIDPLSGAAVKLPRSRAGLIVLYSVFDRVSYGLVAEANQPIAIDDLVEAP